MPWKRDAPDPLEARRRQLVEQEKMVAEQRRKLTEEIQNSGVVKRPEPLVWRNEDDTPIVRTAEPTPSRRRHLARQRQRDMIAAVGLIILFLIVVSLVVWDRLCPQYRAGEYVGRDRLIRAQTYLIGHIQG